MAATHRLALALPLLLACAKKSETQSEPQGQTESETKTKPAGKPGASADAGAGAALKPAVKKTVTVDLAAYKRELASGRKLAKASKYAEAIAALEKALVAKPRDATANSEISWAALQAGDLDRAERAARASVRDGETAKLRAASLYNLGQILEKRTKKPEAITAYQQSLALRPNDTVQRALFSLTRRKAGQFAPIAMSGPATLAEFCEGAAYDVMVYQYPDKPIYEPKCVSSAPLRAGDGTLRQLTLPAPYKRVEIRVAQSIIVDEIEEVDIEHATCHLMIETDAGFYSARLLHYDDNCTSEMSFALERGPDLASGTPTVLVRTTRRARYETNTGKKDDLERATRYCAIGPSGAASCTPSIQTEMRRNGELLNAATATLSGDVLEVTGRDGKEPPNAKHWLGKHALLFP